MLDSASYFDIPITREYLEQNLEQLSASFFTPQRIRLLLDQDGGLSHEFRPLEMENRTLKV